MRYFVSARIAPCSESPLLAVRHGIEVVGRDGIWRESFAPGAWLAGGVGARVELGHDGEQIGSVACVVAHDEWFIADLLVEHDDPDVVRVGQGVSVDARSIAKDDDDDLFIRRHLRAKLTAVAVLLDSERPAYPGARITSVREAPARAHELDREVITTHGAVVRDCGVIVGVR